jgi:hypothetical protein
MITREERDLVVRWVRELRRQQLPRQVMATQERIHRRFRRLDLRTLPSARSPRASDQLASCPR